MHDLVQFSPVILTAALGINTGDYIKIKKNRTETTRNHGLMPSVQVAKIRINNLS